MSIDGCLSEDARFRVLEAERDALRAERDILIEAQERHLKLIAKLSQETPLQIELEGWEAQRRKLIAEVGTLRAQVLELHDLLGRALRGRPR